MLNRDPGEPWRCTRCDVGVTAMKRPPCWNCGSREHVVPAHRYHAPTSASWIHPMMAHVAVTYPEATDDPPS